MLRSHPKKEDQSTLRPVGIALAAVVAGLGSGKAAAAETHVRAPLDPIENAKTHVLDPTNHPGFEEDPEMIVDRSEPVVPLSKR